MRIRISTIKILFYLLLINPILSLCFDNTTVYYFYLTGPIIVLCTIMLLCKRRNQLIQGLICIFCTFISVILALIYKGDIGKINNHLFNYLSSILLIIFISDEKNIENFKNLILNNMKFLKLNVIIINITQLYLLLTNKGYLYRHSWGGNFYHGTNSMPHTLSYLMLVTMILVCLIILFEKDRIFFIFAIIPLYAIFESGARISLVLGLMLLMILIDLTFTKKVKSVFLKVLFVLFIMFVFMYLFRDKIMQSDLWNKITLRDSSGNSSAGRFYIWSDIIDKYINNGNLIQMFFGQGDDKSYYYNSINPLVKSSVWAHNDFIQILIGKGAIGLSIYIYWLYYIMKVLVVKSFNIYTILIIMFVIIACMLNGFYTYKDLSLYIPFIVTLSYFYYGGKNEKSETII